MQRYKLEKKIRYAFFTAVIFFIAGCGIQNSNPLPPLHETYSKNDQNPFGGYIAHKQLGLMYYRNNVNDKKRSFDKTWNDITDTAALYVCFTPYLFVNEDEIDAMMNYVAAGNTLFIAANSIDNDLLKKIGCTQNHYLEYYTGGMDSLRTTHTSTSDSSYAYYYFPFMNSFSFTDTVFTKVLGYNEQGKPDFILFYHGKGKLILHCEPRSFSNYFLLKEDNYRFMQQAFSFTSSAPEHVYWDDYYYKLNQRRSRNPGEKEGASSLGYILSHPAFAWAFWLLFFLLAAYILFGLKRRQRIIEKIKPNENTTVTFTETIGRLYLQKKDNKNIAEKMITYFNEYVRNNYFVNTNTINDEFITTLSRKSGVDREKVEALYRAIQYVNNNAVVDDYQLLSLNQQIQQFYKK